MKWPPAQLVLDRLDELSHYFPHGLEYKVAYETTSFVKASIEDVVKTLLKDRAGLPWSCTCSCKTSAQR